MFVLCGTLQMSFGVCCAGSPLRGVISTRSVLNVFHTRCRAVCARVRRVRAADDVGRVGAKNDVVAAQLEKLWNGDGGRKYVSRYYILVTYASRIEFVRMNRKSRALVAGVAWVVCVLSWVSLPRNRLFNLIFWRFCAGFINQLGFDFRKVRVCRICEITYA